MKKIFITEDNNALLTIYKNVFELSGYEVETADNGEESLEKLSVMEPKPDLILLDIMMPKVSGFEVLEKVKKDPKLKNIPLIVLTNLASLNGSRDLERIKELGAIAYLVKSDHDPHDIVNEVKKIIEKEN